MSPSSAPQARGRRVAHLVSRFFGSLRARPLDATTVAWVAPLLEPGEQRVWTAMTAPTRPRGWRSRGAADALAGTPDADDARWRAAALLHDAGKQLSGFGTVGRAHVTAIAMVAGRAASACGRWVAVVGACGAHGPATSRTTSSAPSSCATRRPRPRSRRGPGAHHGPTGGPPASRPRCAGRWPPPTASRWSGPRPPIESKRPRCRYTGVAYRPEHQHRSEGQYFVRLDAPPRTSARRDRPRCGLERAGAGEPPAPAKRRRRPMTVRPVGLVLVRCSGGSGGRTRRRAARRRGSATGSTRSAATSPLRASGPGLRQTATYFNQLYATAGQLPEHVGHRDPGGPERGLRARHELHRGAAVRPSCSERRPRAAR